MSLITRCPACTTLFKVVPDQLRVSEGWVRCGQCDEVFDANVHLQGDPQAQASSGTPSTSALAEPTATQADEGIPTSPESFDVPEPSESSPEQALAAQLDWPEESGFERDPLLDIRPGESLPVEPSLHLDLPEDVHAAELDSSPELAMDLAPDVSSPAQDYGAPVLNAPSHAIDLPARTEPQGRTPEMDSPEQPLHAVRPSFLRQAKPPSAWSRPWVRASLVTLSLVLLLGLALQVVVHQRDRLAANVADLRPMLLSLCEVLDCKISPFRQIDSVVIENSAFVKVRGDVYRLNITLKNTAAIDIAAPAVELTLTDLQEQPMIRQVLSAADLGASGASLVAGGELSVAIPVQVKTSSPADRINGYRLLAFYP